MGYFLYLLLLLWQTLKFVPLLERRFISLFFLSNLCWCCVLAFNQYLVIVKRHPDVTSYEKFFHIFAWGLPGLIMIFFFDF